MLINVKQGNTGFVKAERTFIFEREYNTIIAAFQNHSFIFAN